MDDVIIIETCPECGHDLADMMFCSNPPIPEKYCMRCGWRFVGKPQKIVRIPFGGNSNETMQ